MPTVEYNLDGDSSGLVQEVSQAASAVAALETAAEGTTAAVGKLTDAQKRAAAAAKESRKEFADNVATAKHLGEMFKWGAESAGRLVSGLIGIVRSAVDAREELKAFLDADAQGNLDRLATDLEAADNAASVLGATFASELAPEIEEVIQVAIGAASAIGDFIKALRDIKDSEAVQALMEIADILATLATLGMNQAIWSGIETLGDKGEEAAESLKKVVDVQELIALEDIEIGRRAEIEARKAEKLAQDARKRAEDRVKHLQEMQEAIEKGAQDEAAANAAAREKQKRDDEAYQEFRYESWKSTLADELSELEAYTKEVESNFNQESEAYEDMIKKRREGTREAAAEIGENWLALGGQLADIWQENAENYIESLQTEREALKDQIAANKGQMTDLQEQQLKDNRKATQEARKEAKAAFVLSQSAAVASILLSGAMAFAALTANMAAYLGPFAPAAAAAIAVPVTLGQLAVVANTQGPAHDGRVFGADEFFSGGTLMRQGERRAVINQRAVDAGAADVVNEMNRTGRTPGGDRQGVLVMDGRVIGEALVRDARRSGSRFAAGTDGAKNPFGRR